KIFGEGVRVLVIIFLLSFATLAHATETDDYCENYRSSIHNDCEEMLAVNFASELRMKQIDITPYRIGGNDYIVKIYKGDNYLDGSLYSLFFVTGASKTGLGQYPDPDIDAKNLVMADYFNGRDERYAEFYKIDFENKKL